MLDGGYDPEEYLDCLDTMKTAMKEKEYFAKHPEEADEEEEQWLDACIEEWQEELEDMEEDWEPDEESKMEEEREQIQKWVKEKKEFLHE